MFYLLLVMGGIGSGTAPTRWIVSIVRTASVEIGVLTDTRNGTWEERENKRLASLTTPQKIDRTQTRPLTIGFQLAVDWGRWKGSINDAGRTRGLRLGLECSVDWRRRKGGHGKECWTRQREGAGQIRINAGRHGWSGRQPGRDGVVVERENLSRCSHSRWRQFARCSVRVTVPSLGILARLAVVAVVTLVWSREIVP